jgi:hypothetical protein
MTNSTDLAISWDEWHDWYRYNGWYPCTRRHTREKRVSRGTDATLLAALG